MRPLLPPPRAPDAYRTRPAAFHDALEALDAVGIPLLLGSRLVPRDVVEQKADELATFMADSASPAIIHLGKPAPSFISRTCSITEDPD